MSWRVSCDGGGDILEAHQIFHIMVPQICKAFNSPGISMFQYAQNCEQMEEDQHM